MNRTWGAAQISFVLGWGALAGCGAARAATIEVPADFPTIDAGLQAANPGDTVLVAPGFYDQYVVLPSGARVIGRLRPNVSLVSSGGPEVTTLHVTGDHAGQAACLVAHSLEASALVDGFTMTASGFGDGIVAEFMTELTVRNCDFRNLNAGGYDGSGISSYWIDHLIVQDCEFFECRTSGVGSAINQKTGSATIERCEVRSCEGPAVYLGRDISGGSWVYQIRDCEFIGNVSTDNSVAALQYDGGSHLLENCVFVENVSNNGNGGAVRASGGIVRNNLFIRNATGHSGGGIYYQRLSLSGVIEGNLFFENACGFAGDGGSSAVYMQPPVAPIRNNILVGNAGGKAIGWNGVGPSPVISCNLFWSNPQGDFVGNLDLNANRFADPQFCSPATGDFTVNVTSIALPQNSGGCGLIGPFGQGCGVISVEETSWGRLKALYRE